MSESTSLSVAQSGSWSVYSNTTDGLGRALGHPNYEAPGNILIELVILLW